MLGRLAHYFGIYEDDIDYRLTEASLMAYVDELKELPPIGCVFIVTKER